MRIFRAITDVDTRGNEWSPSIRTVCPYCHKEILFFSQLPYNECKSCLKRLPFEAGMAKNLEKRIAYHVQNVADGNTK